MNAAVLNEWPWAAVLDKCPVAEVATAAGRLTVRRCGSGPDLVFLHGIGSGAASWAWQLAGLADRFRVTAWNAPGYGGSTPLEAEWPDAGDYADSLDRLLHSLDIRRCVLVGHSLGALIAARLAVESPQLIAGLVLVDPAGGHGRLDSDERRRRLADRIALFRDLGVTGHAAERAPRLLSADAKPEQVALVRYSMERLEEIGYLKAARLLSVGDIHGDVARISGPALVVCGSADRITPPEECRAIAEAFPDACPFVDLPGAGHASYIEAPDRFNAIVRDFAEAVA